MIKKIEQEENEFFKIIFIKDPCLFKVDYINANKLFGPFTEVKQRIGAAV